jgi:hypothetical protein
VSADARTEQDQAARLGRLLAAFLHGEGALVGRGFAFALAKRDPQVALALADWLVDEAGSVPSAPSPVDIDSAGGRKASADRSAG